MGFCDAMSMDCTSSGTMPSELSTKGAFCETAACMGLADLPDSSADAGMLARGIIAPATVRLVT